MSLNLGRQLEPLLLLKKFCKLVLTLLSATAIFGLFVIFTPQGSRIALNLVSDLIPYELRYESVSGTLAKHIEMKGFEIKGNNLHIKASQLEMSWQWQDLFKSQKKLQAVKAEKLVVWYEDDIEPSKTHSSIDQIQIALKKILPFALSIEHLVIDDARIHWNKIEHQLNKLTIKGASNTLSQIDEIHYQGAFGSLDAFLQGAIKVNWDLTLTQNPYLVKMSAASLTTQGNILLPSRNLADPQNQIQIHIQTKQFTHASHQFEDVALDIQGTLIAHQAHFKSIYNKHPIESVIHGQFTQQQWHGHIKKLTVKEAQLQKMGNTTGDILVNWQGKTVLSTLMLILDKKYPIHINTSINKKMPYALEGALSTQILNVKSLSSLVPSLRNLRGKLTVDLTLSGNLSNVQWQGDIVLSDAKFRASTLSKKAVLNNLKFSLLPANKISVNGSGTWGSGKFTLLGEGKLNAGSPNMVINFKGEQLLLSDTTEYYIVANPDLKLTIQNKAAALEGKIYIPQAEIQSLKNPDMVSPSEDVVIVSNKKSPLRKPLTEDALSHHMATNIELILSDKITYKGHGFSTKVDGRLSIVQRPGQVTNAKGKLYLKNGKYKAYGKVFDINYGQILFTGGPIYDPIIDIRAQRTIQQTTFGTFQSAQPILAGIMFSGNFKTPKISFYSTPSMPDADVISYLVVGRPQNKMNEAQAELLFQAVSELANLMGGSRKDVHFDLAEKLKLDQLGFAKKPNFIPTPGSHNPLEDTVFVLGKQLSDRLYLNYSVGLVDSASQFGMRYALGKNLMIEASTGSQGSSADVLLSFEGR
ncbi:MAG: translocation/assembly module TamB domain-containing protein [Proteobacteria bacterium]|nr:translocation/assembly module TamB domain-containing protein [Pseudomonadota bacterium]